jgi:hypothetical protein
MARNYWMHHITLETVYSVPLLEEEGYLSIGFVGENAEDIEDTRRRNSYKRFVNEMKIGDVVIVPHPGQSDLGHLCLIIGNSIKKADLGDLNFSQLENWIVFDLMNDVELGHFRKVVCIRTFDRNKDISEELSNKMSLLEINRAMDECADEIEALISEGA